MNNKLKKVLIPLISVLLAVGVFFLGFLTRELTYSDNQKALLNILDKYEKYYYFEDENVIDVISDAIFDKYSTYLTKEEYEKILKESSGEQEGIGVSFYKDSLQIYKVSVNSPCYNAGVKEGGIVEKIKVNGEEKTLTQQKELTDIISKTAKGENLLLTISYGGTSKEYTVCKNHYKKCYVSYIDESGTYLFIEENGSLKFKKVSDIGIDKSSTAYIKYEQFSGRDDSFGSVYQLKTALEFFKQKSKKNLIFDLRDNGGGYMDVLTEVCSMLIEKEGDSQVISIAKDKHGKAQLFQAKNNVSSSFGFEKIIVLANENTASASEVLIGALIDYDKSNKVSVVLQGHQSGSETIYKTYGKGIMQTTYKNLDGSAVKVTSAKIFWPKSNISIHDVGVTDKISNKVKNSSEEDALDYALNLI